MCVCVCVCVCVCNHEDSTIGGPGPLGPLAAWGGNSLNMFSLAFVFIDLLRNESYCARYSLRIVISVTEHLVWIYDYLYELFNLPTYMLDNMQQRSVGL